MPATSSGVNADKMLPPEAHTHTLARSQSNVSRLFDYSSCVAFLWQKVRVCQTPYLVVDVKLLYRIQDSLAENWLLLGYGNQSKLKSYLGIIYILENLFILK